MKLTFVFLCIFACSVFGVAQAPAAPASTAAPVKDPVTASLRMLLPRSQKNTLGAISAMPADKFNYKPTPDQMTFAHLVVHIIGSNNDDAPRRLTFPRPRSKKRRKPIPKTSCWPQLRLRSTFARKRWARWTIPNSATALSFSADISSPRHGRAGPGQRMGRSLCCSRACTCD